MLRRTVLLALRDSLLLAPLGAASGATVLPYAAGDENGSNQRFVKLFIAGDVMTGRGIDQILRYPNDPVLHEDYVKDARDYVSLAEHANGPIPKPVDERYIWGEALTILDRHKPDVRIVNLETSVTASDDHWPGKGIHYRMHPRNVTCLTAAELDCCALANNHVLDWGAAGLAETLVSLQRAGVQTAGAGRDLDEAMRPARLAVPGKPDVLVFAVADASSGVPHAWAADEHGGGVYLLDGLSRRTAKRVADRITALRQPRDVVLLSIHWGGNWGYRVPDAQQEFAHALIDTGAVDIVHGHSSHHPKAIEFYGGKVILYGSGDLVNDYEGIGGRTRYRPWLAPMYFVTVNGKTREIVTLEIEILRMLRFRLIKAEAADQRWLQGTLNDVSATFDTCFESGEKQLRAHRCIAAD